MRTKRRIALKVSLSLFLLLLLLLTACSLVAPTKQGGEAGPTVRVSRVVDGDTIELEDGRKVRYIGVNTPERGQPFYEEATDFNRQLVEGRRVRLEFDLDTMDQYGRLLAYVWVDDTMVNLEMVRQGYANVYTVPPNVKYESLLREAEREAREAGRGLWAASTASVRITQINADAPGSDRENPNGEWIELMNTGDAPVDLTGYTLKDEANHIYTFPSFVLEPGQKVRVYSGKGRDTKKALYWGLENEAVWNNDGDVAFLRDSQGNLVDTFAY